MPRPHAQVQLSVPFAQTAVSTRAAFEVRSPKLLNVRFEQGTVATPQLLEGVELPNTVSVMGQTVDLTPLQVCCFMVGGVGGCVGGDDCVSHDLVLYVQRCSCVHT